MCTLLPVTVLQYLFHDNFSELKVQMMSSIVQHHNVHMDQNFHMQPKPHQANPLWFHFCSMNWITNKKLIYKKNGQTTNLEKKTHSIFKMINKMVILMGYVCKICTNNFIWTLFIAHDWCFLCHNWFPSKHIIVVMLKILTATWIFSLIQSSMN